ncbi:MAG: hypothetical protein ACPL1Y_01300 [Thermoplasmata archaeon]
MEKEKIASLIEEIARMPEMKNVPREQIEATVNEILSKGINLKPEEAKKVLLNRLAPETVSSGVIQSLADLRPGMRNVSVAGKVLFVAEGTIQTKDGTEKKVLKGLISDNTKKLNFVVWNPDKYTHIVEKGAVLVFKNIYTTEWQKEPQINTSESTEILAGEDSVLPNYRLGTMAKIKDLPAIKYPVTMDVRILSVEKKVVNVNGAEKTLYSGIVADETGVVRFTSWVDFDFKENEVIRINGAYKKIWKDMQSIVLDEKSRVERQDDSSLPPATELLKPREVVIEEIYENEHCNFSNVKIEGFLIEIKDGSGLIYRCPDCGLVLRDGKCKNHGVVKDSRVDLRIKGVFDDGTGAIIAVFPQEVCEKLLGKSITEYQALVGKNGITNPAILDINSKLLGRCLQLIGDAIGGDLGTTFIVRDANSLQIDWKVRAESILSEMEV